MELIRYQAKAEETAAAADDKGEENDDDDGNNWDGNVGKNTQEEGGGGGSGRGDKVRSAKDGSYEGVTRESTLATGSPDMEYYALFIEAWARLQRWNLGDGGICGGGGGATGIYPSSIRRGYST